MGKQFDQIGEGHLAFIQKQKMFFVGTAAEAGRVNVSPKGLDSLRVINPTQVAWLNVTGSGNETAAHVQKLPRMTLMFCAFEGAPIILRLYGQATVHHPRDPEWTSLAPLFPALPGARQIFVLDVELVQSSCGMAVPLYDYAGDRDQLVHWAEKKGPEGLSDYWKEKNQTSIDGEPTHILPPETP